MPVTLPFLLMLWCALAPPLASDLIPDVRDAIAKGDFARAQRRIDEYRQARGVTTEWLAALSWMGRGALAQKRLDDAERYAQETYELATKQFPVSRIDTDRDLEIALGAAIEVQGQVMGARGERTAAVAYLQDQLAKYGATRIHTRVQKNINLLSLEGKPAPPLSTQNVLSGPKLSLAARKGRPVLLFFWAHWCGDCKQQGPVLAKLQAEFGPKGLAVMAPTQLYGYVAGGKDASPAEETVYIKKVLRQFYPDLKDVTVTLSAADFRRYGSSTTPTLVLVDREGVVRLYHPGKMSYEDLRAKVAALMAAPEHTAAGVR